MENKPEITKDFLLKEYVVNKKSSYKISEETGYSDRYIRYKLTQFNLSRTQKEAANVNGEFYSPFYSPILWNAPTKRRECYTWSIFFYLLYPDVCRFIHELCDKENYILKKSEDNSSAEEEAILILEDLIPKMAMDFFLLGESFTLCKKENDRISLYCLKPDCVSIVTNLNNPIYTYTPESTSINPIQQEKQIPITITHKEMIHLKRKAMPYIMYGESILRSYFPFLAQRDKIVTSTLMEGKGITRALYENPIQYGEKDIDREIREFKDEIDMKISENEMFTGYNSFKKIGG